MPIGNTKLRTYRKQLGLSQQELAQRAGVSPRSVQFAESAKPNMQRRTLESIAEALNLGYEDVFESDSSNTQDALADGPWNVFRFLKKKLAPNLLAYCNDLDDAQAAIAMMRDSWRAHLLRPGSARANYSLTMADRALNEQYSAYHKRYVELWKSNPDTIRFAVDGETRTGVSVVLPVTSDAYNRLLEGKIDFLKITAGDVLPSSQNLVIDSAVEFAQNPSLPWYRVTETLSFAIFTHLASLAVDPTRQDFRMISFGASPSNTQRLKANGFVLTGKRMPVFEFPILQFAGHDFSLENEQYERSSTVAHVLHLLQRRGLGANRMKRGFVSQALKVYRNAVGEKVVSKSK